WRSRPKWRSRPDMPAFPVSLETIQAARERLAGTVLRTPLVRLNVDHAPAEIFLKLENLQPMGSFKLRGAGNRILQAAPDELAGGVGAAGAENWAGGVAGWARDLGLPGGVVVRETAPAAKVEAIRRLGAKIVSTSFERWLQVFASRRYPGMEGLFVHPFSDA